MALFRTPFSKKTVTRKRPSLFGLPTSTLETGPQYAPNTPLFNYPQMLPGAASHKVAPETPNAPLVAPAPSVPGSPLAVTPNKDFAPPGDMGEMLPGMQSQEASPNSAAAMGFTDPNRMHEGKLDPVRAAEAMAEFERTGGRSPFTPVAPGGTASGIPPGALARTPGFDPRFMNKPKAPLWR